MIYFAQIDGGPIKIGYSNDVPGRMKKLEAHYGRPLSLLATEPGDLAAEGEWHDRFAHLRLGRTEQFRPAPDLMEAIRRPLLVSPNPDTIEVVPPGHSFRTIGVRASAEWAEWLEQGARHCRTDVAKLLDVAAVKYLREQGFDKPPPERVP